MSDATYLTAVEAAAYLKFPTMGAFYSFLYRRRKAGRPITTHRRGSTLLFKKHELDAAMPVEKARGLKLAVSR